MKPKIVTVAYQAPKFSLLWQLKLTAQIGAFKFYRL